MLFVFWLETDWYEGEIFGQPIGGGLLPGVWGSWHCGLASIGLRVLAFPIRSVCMGWWLTGVFGRNSDRGLLKLALSVGFLHGWRKFGVQLVGGSGRGQKGQQGQASGKLGSQVGSGAGEEHTHQHRAPKWADKMHLLEPRAPDSHVSLGWSWEEEGTGWWVNLGLN